MNKSFRLPINSREGTNLVNYLADSPMKGSKSGCPGILVAKSWANRKTSIHVHADIYVRREEKAYQFCWLFMRDSTLNRESHCDWMDIVWRPAEHLHEHELVMLRLTAIGLGSKPRLRLLNDCPCVPIHGKTIQGTALFSSLRRNLDLFVKTPRQPGARWG